MMIGNSWLLPPFYVVLSTLKAVAACKIAKGFLPVLGQLVDMQKKTSKPLVGQPD